MKGNVINVPVDIQPTVSCLPRPMDENFTIAVQLKKKLSYKKVDFKENVRPLRVLTALHWLVNKSDLYKRAGVEIDVDWFKGLLKVQRKLSGNFWKFQKSRTRRSIDRIQLSKKMQVNIYYPRIAKQQMTMILITLVR